MDNRCLILSGRLLDGQDPATVHARLAAAFGMEMSGFRERVFERAPLIIRRGLDAASADAQAEQLRSLGVEADVLPDSDSLVWLRRAQQVRGPLPEEALDRYAEPGDQWCHDGGQEWFAWQPAANGIPPLPTHEHLAMDTMPAVESGSHGTPPPLPPASAPSPAPAVSPGKSVLSTMAVVAMLFSLLSLLWRALSPVAVLLALGVLFYLYRRPLLRGRAQALVALIVGATALFLWTQHPTSTPVAQPYVARPLKPLAAGTPAARETPAQCATQASAPKNDEDRFLLTGQRMLTGRAQRKGDTYVAEAVVSVDAQCKPSALQLYVFRHGVFIGPALESAASLATTRLTDFDLTDDQHLRVTLAQCTDRPGDCAATTVRQFAVLPGGGGWTLGEIK